MKCHLTIYNAYKCHPNILKTKVDNTFANRFVEFTTRNVQFSDIVNRFVVLCGEYSVVRYISDHHHAATKTPFTKHFVTDYEIDRYVEPANFGP